MSIVTEVPNFVSGDHRGHVLTTRSQAPMIADCSCGEELVATGMPNTPGVVWRGSTHEYIADLERRCATSGCYTWAMEPQWYVVNVESLLEDLPVE